MKDEHLKQALAKMLPETVCAMAHTGRGLILVWKNNTEVRDTELLHLCSLAEHTLSDSEEFRYIRALHEITKSKPNGDFGQVMKITGATWQQRVHGLVDVKGYQ